MPSCAALGCTSRDEPQQRGQGVTFHRFPQCDPDRLKRWVKNTGRSDWIPTARSQLCSKHFTEDCFDKTGQTCRLRQSAVPTIFPFRDCRKKKKDKASSPSGKKSRKRNLKPEEKSDEPPATAAASMTPTSGQSWAESMHVQYVTSNTTVTSTLPVKTNTLSAPSTVAKWAAPMQVTFRRNRCHDHAYAIMESPTALKHKLDFITEELRKHRKKIKVEQQKSRRLKLRLTKMTTLVDSLQNEKKTSSSCADLLEANLSGVPKELLKRVLNSQNKKTRSAFPEELRSFAMTLYSLSPKAYKYVRQTFEHALPYPPRIRSWSKGKTQDPIESTHDDPSHMEIPVLNDDKLLDLDLVSVVGLETALGLDSTFFESSEISRT